MPTIIKLNHQRFEPNHHELKLLSKSVNWKQLYFWCKILFFLDSEILITYNMTNHYNHVLKQFEFWCEAVFFSAFVIISFNVKLKLSIWLNWRCTIMIRFGRNLSSGARVSSSPASASLASSPTSPPSSPSSPLRSASS